MRELGQPTYIEEVIKSPELIENLEDSDGDDELYNQAVEFVVETRRHQYHQFKENLELATIELLV